MRSYAIPLFALINRQRFVPDRWVPEHLAEQLHLYCRDTLGIVSLDAGIIQAGSEYMLLLKGVEDSTLPALLALADTQKTQLFEYRRDSEDSFSLTPLLVKPD